MRAGEFNADLLLSELDQIELLDLGLSTPPTPQSPTPPDRSPPSQTGSKPGSQPSSKPSSRACSRSSSKERKKSAVPVVARHKRESHIKAELKRRFKIQQGFEDLKSMVPYIDETNKDSKAAMLFKTIDFLGKLTKERKERQTEIEELRNEVVILNGDISAFQACLPENGLKVNSKLAPLSGSSSMKKMLEQYVEERVCYNWRFWIFSMLVRSLFESFNVSVISRTEQEFYQSLMTWLKTNCSLVALRPLVLSTLRELSMKTSVMTKPELLQEEALQSVLEESSDRTRPVRVTVTGGSDQPMSLPMDTSSLTDLDTSTETVMARVEQDVLDLDFLDPKDLDILTTIASNFGAVTSSVTMCNTASVDPFDTPL